MGEVGENDEMNVGSKVVLGVDFSDGAADGSTVGMIVGSRLGMVTTTDGSVEEVVVGLHDGTADGSDVGKMVGS